MVRVNGENTIGYGIVDNEYKMYQSIAVYDFKEAQDTIFTYFFIIQAIHMYPKEFMIWDWLRIQGKLELVQIYVD